MHILTRYLAPTLMAIAATCPPPFARAATTDSLAACDSRAAATVVSANSNRLSATAFWYAPAALHWPTAPEAAHYRLHHAQQGNLSWNASAWSGTADHVFELQRTQPPGPLPTDIAFAGPGLDLRLSEQDTGLANSMLPGQWVLTAEDSQGSVLAATALQMADMLDARFFEQAKEAPLGPEFAPGSATLHLWAPTAITVAACLYPGPTARAGALLPLTFDAKTGVWSTTPLRTKPGWYYQYLVTVHVRGTGIVRNRVTDPYSVSLSADSARSMLLDLDHPATKPPHWDNDPAHALAARRVSGQTGMSIYELHVRDFSDFDHSVPLAHRGKFLAFTDSRSRGMQHLRELSAAGITDLHLLPVFDFGTVPETHCMTPRLHGGAASTTQQALTMRHAEDDCYNWGYDPVHFNAPEGSYASDAQHGEVRVRELRAAILALHRLGLRVGMDVVYNHTYASGQARYSVLDRIVPDYYQRLDAHGEVEHSTCCDNTAPEHRMMGKLILDSLSLWARAYKIDSFRFDLMAHLPRELLEHAKERLGRIQGHPANLLGEGWNFGEVANGARFTQASQLSLGGSGIATFSDRARDALRGGNGEGALGIVQAQGFLNGLDYDPNPWAAGHHTRADLLRAADMVRVGLAGSLKSYRMQASDGHIKTLAEIAYGDQPAGYAESPDEVVNYVENHDNQTLFDLNAYKLPPDTAPVERVRSQMLGAAFVAFSQGVAYFHAGQDTLRSKSMDGNSFNSGDWFNRIDWSYRSNGYASGMPPERDNRERYPLIAERLSDARILPGEKEIRLMRELFRQILQIRASTSLFHLNSSEQVSQRLQFHLLGPEQEPTVIIASLDGRNVSDAGFQRLVLAFNVDKQSHDVSVPELKGLSLQLHPVLRGIRDRERAIDRGSQFEMSTGRFRLTPRSCTAWVE